MKSLLNINALGTFSDKEAVALRLDGIFQNSFRLELLLLFTWRMIFEFFFISYLLSTYFTGRDNVSFGRQAFILWFEIIRWISLFVRSFCCFCCLFCRLFTLSSLVNNKSLWCQSNDLFWPGANKNNISEWLPQNLQIKRNVFGQNVKRVDSCLF